MSERRLAAILFTDIVGDTAMMPKDKCLAVRSVKLFERVQRRQASQWDDESVQHYADRSLTIFPGATNTLNCAMSIELRSGDVVPLGIGIHLGEILSDGKGAFGDDVNQAFETESIVIADGVPRFNNVYQQIKNNRSFATDSMGHFHHISYFMISVIYAGIDDHENTLHWPEGNCADGGQGFFVGGLKRISNLHL